MPNCDLGFIHPPEHSWSLHSAYFPSKLGGKPAWLDTEFLPSINKLACRYCSEPSVFLLQLYAPNGKKDHTFHRTVYVFCCRDPKCYKDQQTPFVVLRCCLPKNNKYYSLDPPDYDSSKASDDHKTYCKLCQVCGCKADKVCANCKNMWYCCRSHQVRHWKLHKPYCNAQHSMFAAVRRKSFLFPQHEILIDSDESGFDTKEEDDDNTCDVTCEDVSATDLPTNPDLVGITGKELAKFAVNNEDKVFNKFKKAISGEPDQVVRYERGANPLWCSADFRPTAEDIPSCVCGAKRQFEFQIMPQLLRHLDVDISIDGPTVDWGTVAVYTCPNDCTSSDEFSSYHIEFAWRQIFTMPDSERPEYLQRPRETDSD